MRIAFDTFNLGVTAGSGNKTYTVELIKASVIWNPPTNGSLSPTGGKKPLAPRYSGNTRNALSKAFFRTPNSSATTCGGP